MSRTVIDVSKHQGAIDWTKVKVDGAMIRLGYRGYGQGTLEIDSQFLANVRGCVNNKIPFGVYWFTTATNAKEGKEEAEFVLKNISGYNLSFPIFIDSEYSNAKQNGRSDDLPKSVRTAAVRAFCLRIEEAGYMAGVYASESWFKSQLEMSSLPYHIWCAKYSSNKPTYPSNIDAWQYTSSGTMTGVTGKVDFSHWYADYENTTATATTQTVATQTVKKDIVPVSYLQTDSRWKNNKYAVKDETSTIGSAGCGPTSAAMVIASLADSSVTPATTAKWSMNNGYKAYHQGTYYSYFTPQMKAYGITCTQLNYSTVYHGAGSAKSINAKTLESVKNGNWMIVCMGKGDWTSSGHFILWYGVEGNYALIRDPNSTKASRTKALISTMQYQAKYYFEVIVPTEEVPTGKEEDDMMEEQVLKIINKWFYDLGLIPISESDKPDLDWAYENGIMKDGAYNRPATRKEVAIVAHRLYDMIKESKETE